METLFVFMSVSSPMRKKKGQAKKTGHFEQTSRLRHSLTDIGGSPPLNKYFSFIAVKNVKSVSRI